MARRVVLLILPVALVLMALYVDGYPGPGSGRDIFVALADGRPGADATVQYSKPTLQASGGTVADVVLSMSAEGLPDSCTGKLSAAAVEEGEYYMCVTALNSGDVLLLQHTVLTTQSDESVLLESELAPGDTMTITNALLDGLGLANIFGPFQLPNEQGEAATSSVTYEGVGLVKSLDDETRMLTATASISITVLADSTVDDESSVKVVLPTITPALSRTSKPTATSTPSSTPAPVSPIATPEFLNATPTLTAISVSPLATPPAPSAPADDDTAMAASLTATAEAVATITALDATTSAISGSPLTEPTATSTPLPTFTPTQVIVVQDTPIPDTSTPEPTATMDEAAMIVPPTAGPQRPFYTPTPEPTPDYLLMAAEAFDKTLLAATWIWFMAGSLLFFAVAGVLAGLAFWRDERNRYTFVARYPTGAELVGDDPFPTPPPPPHTDLNEDLDDWPESLP